MKAASHLSGCYALPTPVMKHIKLTSLHFMNNFCPEKGLTPARLRLAPIARGLVARKRGVARDANPAVRRGDPAAAARAALRPAGHAVQPRASPARPASSQSQDRCRKPAAGAAAAGTDRADSSASQADYGTTGC